MLLKWYFSAFKTGRKPISKKPYNPIIGEIFQCYYTLPAKTTKTEVDTGDLRGNQSKDEQEAAIDISSLSDSGPVPWSNSTDVAFIAEQVSHHPPSMKNFPRKL